MLYAPVEPLIEALEHKLMEQEQPLGQKISKAQLRKSIMATAQSLASDAADAPLVYRRLHSYFATAAAEKGSEEVNGEGGADNDDKEEAADDDDDLGANSFSVEMMGEDVIDGAEVGDVKDIWPIPMAIIYSLFVLRPVSSGWSRLEETFAGVHGETSW